MRLKELRGLPVIDPTAARKVGIVTDYQVDPATARIAALDVSIGDDSPAQRVPGHCVRRVGRHAVVLTDTAGVAGTTDAPLNEHWLDPASLVGLEVMGADGNRIGRLDDALFDQDTLAIEAYLLRSSGYWDQLTGKVARIEPRAVHACSRQLMIVASAVPSSVTPAATTADTAERPESPAREAPAVSVAEPLTTSAEPLGVPLKAEDRPAAAPVRDGTPVGARQD